MIKQKLLRIYNWPLLSKEKTNKNQKIIRDAEWEATESFVIKGDFLDVGCGAGYAMKKAQKMGCAVFGIDPDPGGHGVGREGSNYVIENVIIKKAVAESIPFEDEKFDTVYSSHVLEHVNDEEQCLKEMKRVLKKDGVLIIGMPTSHIAMINLFTNTFLNPHHRFVNYFFSPFIKTGKISFRELFIPQSHSFEHKTVFYDLNKYRISNWKKIIEPYFEIIKTVKPAFYPYPETVQWFKLKKNHRLTSSVFFICKKHTM
jgi:ubiquinone/menaquinone biosynthesis C-methylase UbiE